jgi:hypothetical protein
VETGYLAYPRRDVVLASGLAESFRSLAALAACVWKQLRNVIVTIFLDNARKLAHRKFSNGSVAWRRKRRDRL